MTDIFILIIITSIAVIGVKIITNVDMIFENVGIWAEQKVKKGNRIWEPLIVCAWCMPSIYSLIGYGYGIFLFGIPVSSLWMYPIVAMASSLICGFVWTLVGILLQYLNHLDNLGKMSHWDVIDRKKQHHYQQQNNHQNGKSKRQERGGKVQLNS